MIGHMTDRLAEVIRAHTGCSNEVAKAAAIEAFAALQNPTAAMMDAGSDAIEHFGDDASAYPEMIWLAMYQAAN